MIQIREIAFSCYAVSDMSRARAFYEGILGLKPGTVTDTPGGGWVEYEIGAGALSLGCAPGWKPSADGCTVALEVVDFDSAIAELKARNVAFRMEPFASPVCRMAMILDPDGNTVCIHRRNGEH
ncbi:MAG: VOC family protein [Verrucomicrobia bacterium]|nr:VOC family protein [Verrucomicrobiota bacterium]